jgi:hypothetical protein
MISLDDDSPFDTESESFLLECLSLVDFFFKSFECYEFLYFDLLELL